MTIAWSGESRPLPNKYVAMTFTEIGEAMGISRKMAFLIYQRGMNKLRSRPVLLGRLLELSIERQKLIAEEPEL